VVDRQVIELAEIHDGWQLLVHDAQVGQVAVGHELRIVLYGDNGESAEITIATPFRVRYGESGTWSEIDPETDDSSLGQLILNLRNRSLLGGFAQRAGTLSLELAGPVAIQVPPHPQYEAWDVDAKQFKIVGVPGDEPAVWRR
jgi:hypothetical protein